MSDVADLRDTTVPRSDQLNAEDLLSGPLTVRIESVRRGSGKEQPVSVGLAGLRPFMPCKTMRRVLIAAWGEDGRAWVGRSMRLFRDPEVAYGGVKVGGIRISHLSHIDGPVVLMLATTRGKRSEFRIEPLVEEAPKPAKAPAALNPAKALWAAMAEETVKGRAKTTLAGMYPGREAKSLTLDEVQRLHDVVFGVTVAREPGQDDDYTPGNPI